MQREHKCGKYKRDDAQSEREREVEEKGKVKVRGKGKGRGRRKDTGGISMRRKVGEK